MGNDLLSLNINSQVTSSFIKSNNEINRIKNTANDLNKKDKSQEEIVNAAKDFEALLLNQMINEMWKTVPQDSLFGKNQEQEYFQEMLNTEISKEISMGQGLGIQDLIIAELNKTK